MGEWSIKKEQLNAILKKHKLELSDYEKIVEILEREPNLIELGIFSAMWSEHCSYKSSKIYLKGFPTEASWVLQGPGENAGVIDIGDNLAAIFKIESHNHPSFIEPNAGAATGVGGILRDIFTMGANPIINLNSIRFGDILDSTTICHIERSEISNMESKRDISRLRTQYDKTLDSNMRKKHIHLLHGVVEGIGHYGNCMGIPTIGGETSFESCYNGNILVNAFSLGIAKQDEIFYGKASGEGNPIMYVGSKTGRDGLGGAVMSSDSFDSASKALRPTVQIGDPFVEKSLLEACLEVFQKDLIVGIQDMGAAGLTSSSFEMASRSGSGMVMWLDKIPMRESGMTPYELMLSESQERMLLCAKKGAEKQIKDIFAKYELSAEIVGEVRNTGKMELLWHDKLCATLPIAPIVENAPMLNRAIQKPKYLESCKTLDLEITNKSLQKQLNANHINTMQCSSTNLNTLTKSILKSLDVCDKSWIYNQYDDSIKASTIKGAGMLGSSVVALHNYNSKKALSVSVKCNVRYCYLDPKIGAKIAVAQAGRDVALSGAKPLAITDCLNFGSPENPEVMWQFRESCEGIKEACKTLKTPVVSGNVSLYNQTNDEAIYPTPSIVSVGLLEDSNKAIGSHFIRKDSYICMLGVMDNSLQLSGSVLQKIIGAKNSGVLQDINLESELKLWEILNEGIAKEYILSTKDIAQGGLAITLCKMAIVGKTSVEVLTDKMTETLAKDFIHNENLLQDSKDYEAFISQNKLMLFSENHTQVICEVKDLESVKNLFNTAKQKGLSLCVIGKVANKHINTKDITNKDSIKIHDINLSLQEAHDLYYKSFETYL